MSNDNIVNATGFSILRHAFGTAPGNPNYDDRADFNGDQVVNSTDFTLLKNNFGTAGSPPLGP
jgi:Dockerin type I domain